MVFTVYTSTHCCDVANAQCLISSLQWQLHTLGNTYGNTLLITHMNIIIKLIRHRNHGGYKSVTTSYARAVQLIQPSRMSNNLTSRAGIHQSADRPTARKSKAWERGYLLPSRDFPILTLPLFLSLFLQLIPYFIINTVFE